MTVIIYDEYVKFQMKEARHSKGASPSFYVCHVCYVCHIYWYSSEYASISYVFIEHLFHVGCHFNSIYSIHVLSMSYCYEILCFTYFMLAATLTSGPSTASADPAMQGAIWVRELIIGCLSQFEIGEYDIYIL